MACILDIPPIPQTELHVFAVGGQSNASGMGTGGPALIVPGSAYEYVSGVGLQELADPVGNANVGSAWPAFANAYYSATGKISVFVPCAYGGTAQTDKADAGGGRWTQKGNLRQNLMRKTLAAMSDLMASGYNVRMMGVLWCQGERDAQQIDDVGNITGTEYQTALELMISFYRSIFGAAMPFWIYQTGQEGVTDTAGFAAIRAAQAAVAAADPYAYLCFDQAVDFYALGYMQGDGLHYTQDGLDLMGQTGAEYMADVLAGLPE